MESFEDRLDAARQASARQEWAAGLAIWHAISEAFPDQPEGFIGKAETLIELGRLDDAESVLAEVVDRFPTQVYVAAGHARVAAQRQDWGEALMRWGAVRERFPDHPIPYVGQGEVFLAIGQPALAEAAFARALGLAAEFPQYEWAAVHYAEVATQRGDWREALDRWTAVRTKFPQIAAAWTKSAEALDQLGRADEAREIRRLAETPFAAVPRAGEDPEPLGARSKPVSAWGKAQHHRRPSGFSAYLSIFNDWDILAEALRSIAPLIDELVVVDGAYKWMVPYLDKIGCNPARSQDRVYQIIESAGIPFRVITNTWEDEAEKRMAGFAACRYRFVCRVDADEILFPDHDAIEAFLKQEAAVGEMEAPLYIAPGWIVTPREGPLPRAGFLFDSAKIGAADHLRYLWLITDRQQHAQPNRQHTQPVAFNAHLTQWRTPSTAIGRAVFYTLNYIRNEGAPWFSDLRSRPLPDLTPLFERLPPAVLHDALMGSLIVAGYGELNGAMIGRSPVAPADERDFYPLFDQYLAAQVRANAELTRQGRYTLGQTYIDLSSPAALAALSNDGTIAMRFSARLADAKVYVQYLTGSAPWEEVREIAPRVDGHFLTLDIPRDPSRFLRRVLRMDVWFHASDPVQRFVIGR